MSIRLEFPSPAQPMVPVPVSRMLCEMKPEDLLQVLSVSAAGPDALLLEKEGILPGSRMRVLRNDARGTVVIQCRTRWVILGRRFSYQVKVGLLADPPSRAGLLIQGPWIAT